MASKERDPLRRVVRGDDFDNVSTSSTDSPGDAVAWDEESSPRWDAGGGHGAPSSPLFGDSQNVAKELLGQPSSLGLGARNSCGSHWKAVPACVFRNFGGARGVYGLTSIRLLW